MFIRLLLLFTIVPMTELALLIWVGRRIGVLPTIFLVAITGVIGVSAAKMQGFLIMNRIKERFSRQQLPTLNMIEGILILMGGAMLLTPGLLTDVTGFLFILPFSRPTIARLAQKYVGGYLKKKGYTSHKSFTFERYDLGNRNAGNRETSRKRREESDVYDIGGSEEDRGTEEDS